MNARLRLQPSTSPLSPRALRIFRPYVDGIQMPARDRRGHISPLSVTFSSTKSTFRRANAFIRELDRAIEQKTSDGKTLYVPLESSPGPKWHIISGSSGKEGILGGYIAEVLPLPCGGFTQQGAKLLYEMKPNGDMWIETGFCSAAHQLEFAHRFYLPTAGSDQPLLSYLTINFELPALFSGMFRYLENHPLFKQFMDLGGHVRAIRNRPVNEANVMSIFQHRWSQLFTAQHSQQDSPQITVKRNDSGVELISTSTLPQGPLFRLSLTPSHVSFVHRLFPGEKIPVAPFLEIWNGLNGALDGAKKQTPPRRAQIPPGEIALDIISEGEQTLERLVFPRGLPSPDASTPPGLFWWPTEGTKRSFRDPS